MENKTKYQEYMKIFLEENSKVNLISKNDEKYLWEKHVFDSLAIENFFEKFDTSKIKTILDIGTGGGFPSIPIAITYPHLKVTALDSIAKKIRAVQTIKDKLNIENLEPICTRVENLDAKFDMITSRAVSSLKNICEYALPKLKKGGYFVAYKSRKTPQEIEEANSILKKYNSKIVDIIEYSLPLEENHERNLIVILKK
ncbi:MAG TPA: 16S rRNA (guanine(527)-N(7))-methyltransferase RsmG [Cyanobacteria bacterium UBA10660]|nr:MAG TPA: 16S rRNA (guanine(527)-N(7))-methyltransferase RsmG [Candidatus Gastranaerophilales bacterium HUM_1]HAS94503.1 16S rRNA (guanine(527)-N(7))-methyltransferase RsmG [Cyanobacteria bacterium UBA10660]